MQPGTVRSVAEGTMKRIVFVMLVAGFGWFAIQVTSVGGSALIKPVTAHYEQAGRLTDQASQKLGAIEQEMQGAELAGNPPTFSERLTLEQTRLAAANAMYAEQTLYATIVAVTIALGVGLVGLGLALAASLVR